MKVSVSHERKVGGYLKPSNFSFLNSYAKVNSISKSQVINKAIEALRNKSTPLPSKK